MGATAYPGSGRPIDPRMTFCPGELPITAVVSVCPKPSRMVMPQAARTCSMTSGLSGSPALTASSSAGGLVPSASRISMRHTVGGAHRLATFSSARTCIVALAEKRA